jgi:aspartate kinase
MTAPRVVKFGGDALATPERIAAAARRVAVRRAAGPVVAVASARRGVTDHLLGLVEQVREAGGGGGHRPASRAALAAADRAVTSGEIVAASLLAVALEELGIAASVLDARETGIRSDGAPGHATITGVRPAHLERLVRRGTVPVVTGFQGWHRGRLTALGRGGSDISAVALAIGLRGEACELVKDPGALHTADPRLVPDARPIPSASHRFVTELAEAGARVIHVVAARSAEWARVPLRFTSLGLDGDPVTLVDQGSAGTGAHAVALTAGYRDFESAAGDPSEVAVVSAVQDAGGVLRLDLPAAVSDAGVTVLRSAPARHGYSLLVPEPEAITAVRAVHAAFDGTAARDSGRRRHASHG